MQRRSGNETRGLTSNRHAGARVVQTARAFAFRARYGGGIDDHRALWPIRPLELRRRVPIFNLAWCHNRATHIAGVAQERAPTFVELAHWRTLTCVSLI